MGKGIISCGLKIDGVHDRDVLIDDVIYIERGKNYEFYLTPDKKYFDTEDNDLSSLIKKAKWTYIMSSFFDTALKKKKGEIYSEWGNFNNNKGETTVQYLGIGNQYKEGDSISFYFNESTNLWLGTAYRVEVFNKVPNDGLHFTIITYVDKYCRYAFFEAPPKEITIQDGEVNDGVSFYGSRIYVEISLHRFGTSKLDPDSNPKDYNIELYLCDEEGNILQEDAFLTEPLSKYVKLTGETSLNNSCRVFFTIDEEWKDKYHEGTELKKYSLEVRIRHIKENKYHSFNIAKKNYSIIGNSGDDEHNVRYLTQNFFSVKKSIYEIFLLNQQEVANKIQYIGDVNYTIKEFDPCGYSSIEIVEKGKNPIEIFNENKLHSGGDETSKFYDIILGDVSNKEVKIIAKNLQNKTGCQSVLLNLKKGEKHSDIHNVFPTKYVYSSLLPKKIDIPEEEKYASKVDNLRVDQKRVEQIQIEEKSQIPKRENNYEGQHQDGREHKYEKDNSQTSPVQDYDPIAVSRVNFGNVQKWVEGTDFTLDNPDNSGIFTINKLNYTYIKTFDSQLAGYLGYDKRSMLDDVVDKLWAFRYFFLYKEFAQIYFIPVSTCRYPNQIAKIRVFPDIKWEVFVLIVPTESAVYEAENMKFSPQLSDHDKKKAGAYKSKNPNLIDYKVELHVKSALKGEVTDLSLGLEQKLSQYLGALSSVKNTLDDISHKNKVVNGAGDMAQKMIAKVGVKAVSAVFIDFSLPSLHVGGNWHFGVPVGGKDVRVIGGIDIALRPLFKGKGGLDLIAAAHYIPYVGQILIAIEVIKDLSELAITTFTPFDVSAKLWFNLYAFGQVDLKLSMDFANSSNNILEPKVTLGIGAELGLKIEASVKKIVFNDGVGDRSTVMGVGAELSGKGEAGLEFKANYKENTKYTTVEGSISFTGVTLEVVGKLELSSEGDKKSKPPTPKGKMPLIDRIDDFKKFSYQFK